MEKEGRYLTYLRGVAQAEMESSRGRPHQVISLAFLHAHSDTFRVAPHTKGNISNIVEPICL